MTGGAGFIGSHLVDSLLAQPNYTVTVLDDFSQGSSKNFRSVSDNDSRLSIFKTDLATVDPATLEALIPDECNEVYHLAANPDVKSSSEDPVKHFSQNIVATFNLLEAVRRKCSRLSSFVYTSTSTVYGEAKEIPTPESYGPTLPISVYGASKLACEAMISSYANLCNFKALILRLANVVGPRSNHGVIHDFIGKLERDHTTLEILGDGTQSKSYLHVSDCISAIGVALENLNKEKMTNVSVLNVGSLDRIGVKKVAEMVCSEMGFKNVKLVFKHATHDGRGWPGDVKTFQLDVSKLKSLGWTAKMNSEQAVLNAIRSLMSQARV